MLVVSESDVESLLTPALTEQLVREAFIALSRGEAEDHVRRRVQSESGILTTMWASLLTEGALGLKAYPILRSDVTQGTAPILVMYDARSGVLTAVIEADLLGRLRTAAASAIASRVLARPDSRVLVVFGTGAQARTQIVAIARAVPALERLLVVGRSAASTQDFIEFARAETTLDVSVRSPNSAILEADIIVTATGASLPLFDGSELMPGTHINAIGSNFATKRELDRQAVMRSRLVVDSLDVAQIECGDVLANGLSFDGANELGSILIGAAPGRTSSSEITLFESHGLTIQDVACGAAIIRKLTDFNTASLPQCEADRNLRERWSS